MYKPDPAITAAGRPLAREPLPQPLFGDLDKSVQCCKSTSYVSVKRQKNFKGSFSEKPGHDCNVPILITEFLFCSCMGTRVGGPGTRSHGSGSGQCMWLSNCRRTTTLPVTNTFAMRCDVPDNPSSKQCGWEPNEVLHIPPSSDVHQLSSAATTASKPTKTTSRTLSAVPK